MSTISTSNIAQTGNLVPFDLWLQSLGKCRNTGWRWRQTYPWLETVNVFGKLYIAKETIAEFERKAMTGELSQNSNMQQWKKQPED